MNSLLALAFAGLLSTAPKANDPSPVRESSDYVVTDKLALWLTDTGKLNLSLGRQFGSATVDIRTNTRTLYRGSLPLQQPVHQSFDLSAMAAGTYEVRVTIGTEVTSRTIQIDPRRERPIQLR